MIGQTLTHYEILESIGLGGMGEIYLAEDPRLGRRYSLKIADALSAAHETGMVHRDIKAANITVTSRNRIRVLDFGLASSSR